SAARAAIPAVEQRSDAGAPGCIGHPPAARTPLHGSGPARGGEGRAHQPGDGSALLAGRESDREAEMKEYLRAGSFEVAEAIERAPYPDIEYQSRGAYIFARPR